jgi:steroid delta-isomerase
MTDSADRAAHYYRTLSQGNVAAVLSMFADDAVMRDPVGTPAATTPEARSQRYAGISAIFETFTITPDEVVPCGDEAAARWTARGRTRTGRDVEFTGMSTFVFDSEGCIAAMSAYWDAGAIARALNNAT